MIAPTRGRNYGGDELKQLVYSVLNVSQDPVIGNGQRSEKFWERVNAHYEQHKPRGAESRGKKSLEGKWGDIKHDVAKFCGTYQQVEGLEISGTNKEDTLAKAHELYKQNNPKWRSFTYEALFWILKDVPRWKGPGDEMATGKRSSRGSSSNGVIDQDPNGTPPHVELDRTDSVHPSSDEAPEVDAVLERKRPGGNKKAKEDLKRQKLDEDALRASLKATQNWERSNAERNYCTQINTMMRLIMMPTASLNPGMREFAEEFQLEEAVKLRAKICEQSMGASNQTFTVEQEAPRPQQPSSPFNESSPLNAATRGDYYVPSAMPLDVDDEREVDPLEFRL